MGLLAALSGLSWFLGAAGVPETYAPVLLRKRAARLSKITGKVYQSQLDIDRGSPPTLAEAIRTALTRPWLLLFKEPIILVLSIYMALIYGVLYCLFPAFPIVYQQYRGWSQGIGGLAFIGVLLGMVLAVLYCIFFENPRYQKLTDQRGGFAGPEARLPPSILGGLLLPVGLFWFAWTNSPSIHWAVSISAGIPFGMGMVLVFLSIFNYLIDSYTIFAASAMAANAVLRSLFGAAFPLFTAPMYRNLGIHWAASIPAFLALACVPFPFLFYKYGARIRAKCKFAAESQAFLERMAEQAKQAKASPAVETRLGSSDSSSHHLGEVDAEKEKEKERDQREYDGPMLEPIRTTRTGRSRNEELNEGWRDNPYDIDRVNTRESFRSGRSQSSHRSRKASRF